MANYYTHAVSTKRLFRIAYTLGIVFLIAVIGSGGMYALINMLPYSHSNGSYILYSIAIIALGLAVPYWILKLALHAAHVWNPREIEFSLKDLTKDQQELEEEKRHAHHHR